MGIDRSKTSAAYKVLSYDHQMVDLERQRISYTRDDSESEALQHSGSTAEICTGPSCFDLCDDVLLFSLFRNSQVFREKGYGYGKPEQLDLKVLVSVIWIVHRITSPDLICSFAL